MTYPYVQAWFDDGPRPWPTLGLMFHMAEGGGTVGYLDNVGKPPERGVSVHAVCEYSGRVVQMLDWTHASGSLNPAHRSTDKGYYGHSDLVAVLGDRWTDPNKVVLAMELEGFAATGPNDKQVAGATAWGLDMRARFPELRGALGHADQTDTKACPGLTANMKAIFAGVGGHGLWEEQMKDIAVATGDQLLVDIPKGTKILNLDGTVRLTASTTRTGVVSPFGSASSSGTATRAIIWSEPGDDLLLAVYTNAVTNPRPVARPANPIELATARAAGRESFRADVVEIP